MPQQIVRLMLITTDNLTVTLCEKMVPESEAWSLYQKLAFDLTGEMKKPPIPPDKILRP